MITLIRLWVAGIFIRLSEFNRDIAVFFVDGKWPVSSKKSKYIVTR